MLKCPECGSERVSGFGSKWKCDECSCEFDKNLDFDEIEKAGNVLDSKVENLGKANKDYDNEEEKEILEKIEKELLENEMLEIESKFKKKREKLKKEKEEEFNNNVSLLEECNDEVIGILSLNNVPEYNKAKDERIDVLARKFDTTTLKSKIDGAEKERDKKQIEYEESVSFLEGFDDGVLHLLAKYNLPSYIRSREDIIHELAKQFNSSTLEDKLIEFSKERKAEELKKAKADANTDKWALIFFVILMLVILFFAI